MLFFLYWHVERMNEQGAPFLDAPRRRLSRVSKNPRCIKHKKGITNEIRKTRRISNTVAPKSVRTHATMVFVHNAGA